MAKTYTEEQLNTFDKVTLIQLLLTTTLTITVKNNLIISRDFLMKQITIF